MASRCHHPNLPPPSSSSSCTTTCCCNPPHPSPLPPELQLTSNQLLQALAFLLHQHQPHPNTHSFFPRRDPDPVPDPNHHRLVSSLAQRISDLESALGRSPPPRSNGRAEPYGSLREAAARVIQTRFRAFLVRRSRALGQLQELAYLKARFVSLKSSVSGRTQFDSEVVSRKAMDLLLGVDSIEGCDPMIRDGKRSITRDLERFLDFVDGFTLRRRVEKSRAVGVRNRNGKPRGSQRERVEELRGRVERIRRFSRNSGDEGNDGELEEFQQFVNHGVVGGRSATRKMSLDKTFGVQPRSTKSVRFAENGDVYWVFNDEREPISNADIRYTDGSDNSGEADEKEFDVVEERRATARGEEDDDEAQSDNGGSSQSSDGERIPKGVLRGSSSNRSNRYYHDQDGDSVSSAPFSAKIEQKADLAKKRQGLKIVG